MFDIINLNQIFFAMTEMAQGGDWHEKNELSTLKSQKTVKLVGNWWRALGLNQSRDVRWSKNMEAFRDQKRNSVVRAFSRSRSRVSTSWSLKFL